MEIPFISITDFTDSWQVQTMLTIAKRFNGPEKDLRKLGVGVMMSYKTLHGLPTKWSRAFPPKEKIAEIFFNDPLALNVLHYADYENQSLFISLCEAANWGGKNLQAIQLDMIWPHPADILEFRANFTRLKTIMQIGAKAFEAVNSQPKQLIARLQPYELCLDYVLLDKSMGQGKLMDASFLLSFLKPLSKDMPHLGLIVAGGLGPDTLHLVKPIIKKFPQISLDAQGRLRPSKNALDPIDWQMAGSYLEQAYQLF